MAEQRKSSNHFKGWVCVSVLRFLCIITLASGQRLLHILTSSVHGNVNAWLSETSGVGMTLKGLFPIQYWSSCISCWSLLFHCAFMSTYLSLQNFPFPLDADFILFPSGNKIPNGHWLKIIQVNTYNLCILSADGQYWCSIKWTLFCLPICIPGYLGIPEIHHLLQLV